MYTNTSMMEENARTWIVHFFAKLCILGKHKGVEKIEGSCVLLLFVSLVTFLLSLIPTKSFATPLCIALIYKFSKTVLQTQSFLVFSFSQFSSVR